MMYRKHYTYEPDYATEPGEILKETIESLGMTQRELASRTGYTTKTHKLVNQR